MAQNYLQAEIFKRNKPGSKERIEFSKKFAKEQKARAEKANKPSSIARETFMRASGLRMMGKKFDQWMDNMEKKASPTPEMLENFKKIREGK